MSQSKNQNVIPFPKTVPFYQQELTQKLENEQYEEAVELLFRMLQLPGVGEENKQEWEALLNWLQMMFPETMEEPLGEMTEAEIFKQKIRSKPVDDASLNELFSLLDTGDIEKQMNTLDRLNYTDHHEVDSRLISWVEQSSLHPIVLQKALQTLKIRDISGNVIGNKLGEKIDIPVESVPLSLVEYPSQLLNVAEKVSEVSESNDPVLPEFIEELWYEFLSFIYGTSIYKQLLEEVNNDEGVRLWASVLHLYTLNIMNLDIEQKEILQLYRLSDNYNEKIDSIRQILVHILG